MKAIYRNVRISPKKANLIASMIRGTMVKKALDQLKYTPKKAARILYRVLKSALSNAENNFNQKGDDLEISKIIVNKGTVYKRHIPISRGRVHPIQKRASHIFIQVNVKESSQKEVSKAKTDSKTTKKDVSKKEIKK